MTPAAGAYESERSPLADLGLLAVIQVLFAGNWVAAKIGLGEVPAFALMTIRFLLLSMLLAPFMRWHRGSMGLVLAIALCAGAIHFGVMFVALALTDQIAALAVVANLGIPFATLLSVIFLKEKVGLWRTSALTIAFGGVLMMGFDPHIVDAGISVALMALASFAWSIGAVLMRRVRGVGVFDMQGWIALGAWPPLAVASLIAEPAALAQVAEATPAFWLALAYMIVASTLIGHGGTYWLLQRHSIARLAPFMLLSPVLSALLGVVWFGNVLSWRLVCGGLLTLSGTLIIMLREGRRRPR